MKNGGTNKHRSFIFTENNPERGLLALREYVASLGVKSFTGQEEKGDQGTVHHQFCIQFRNPRSFQAVKSAFPRAHIEASHDFVAASEYCSKEDTRTDGPVAINPPKKRDAKLGRKERNQQIMELGPEKALDEGLISVSQYPNVVKAVALHSVRASSFQPLEKLDNLWLVGATGTGKSRHAREVAGDDLFVKPINKWWDGYNGESNVLLDDLALEHSCLRTHLLQWADHYPCPVECKGYTMQVRPKRIIVTSNYRPEDIWTREEDYKPFLRRFAIQTFKALNM